MGRRVQHVPVAPGPFRAGKPGNKLALTSGLTRSLASRDYDLFLKTICLEWCDKCMTLGVKHRIARCDNANAV